MNRPLPWWRCIGDRPAREGNETDAIKHRLAPVFRRMAWRRRQAEARAMGYQDLGGEGGL